MEEGGKLEVGCLDVEDEANCSLGTLRTGGSKMGDDDQRFGWLRDASSCSWKEHADVLDNDKKIGSLLYNPGRGSPQAHQNLVWSLINARMDCGGRSSG